VAIIDIVNTKHYVEYSICCLMFDFYYCYFKVWCCNTMGMWMLTHEVL